MKTLLTISLLLISCSTIDTQDSFSVNKLRQGLLSSDELVIFDQAKNIFYKGSTARIKDLSSIIEVKNMADGHDCLCYADFVLIFSRNGSYAFALGLHPGMDLRWTNSPWLSDGKLDKFSFFLILDWIKDEIKVSKRLDNYEIPERLSKEQ